MAALTQSDRDRLGPLIEPFGRSKKDGDRRRLRDGEVERDEFEKSIHDAINNGTPPAAALVTTEEVETHLKVAGRFKEKAFLWVLDETSIKIIREKTRNVRRTHDPDCVCHTNLTGGSKAYLGGEIFFCEDGFVYVNHFSDRYGAPSNEQWMHAKQYFKRVGYQNLVDILDLLSTTGSQ